jgi:hypothetical protein
MIGRASRRNLFTTEHRSLELRAARSETGV